VENLIGQAKEMIEDAFKSELRANIGAYLFRNDGIVLMSVGKNTSKGTGQTIGSLIGGAFQASLSVMGQLNSDSEKVTNILSFGTSSSGIYVVPLMNQQTYLGITYQEVKNPGKVKNKFKNIARKLSENGTFNESLGSEKLFADITDDEIDNLFSFPGS